MWGYISLVPSPPPQLLSLAVRITWRIRTASDDSCGGGLGTRLGEVKHQWLKISVIKLVKVLTY